MASTGSRALDAALRGQQAERERAENLADLVARVETFRERMVRYGGPEAQEWAGVLGKILDVRDAVHPKG